MGTDVRHRKLATVDEYEYADWNTADCLPERVVKYAEENLLFRATSYPCGGGLSNVVKEYPVVTIGDWMKCRWELLKEIFGDKNIPHGQIVPDEYQEQFATGKQFGEYGREEQLQVILCDPFYEELSDEEITRRSDLETEHFFDKDWEPDWSYEPKMINEYDPKLSWFELC